MPQLRAQKSTPKADQLFVFFGRQFADGTLMSLIGATTAR
jgi:hypothetical protein